MARNRTLSPCLWEDEGFLSLEMPAQMLWIGMISHADDHGRLDAGPLSLRAKILRSHTCTPDQVSAWRDQIVGLGMACAYSVAGKSYLHLPHWHRYQYVNRPSRCTIPPCPRCESPTPGQEEQVPLTATVAVSAQPAPPTAAGTPGDAPRLRPRAVAVALPALASPAGTVGLRVVAPTAPGLVGAAAGAGGTAAAPIRSDLEAGLGLREPSVSPPAVSRAHYAHATSSSSSSSSLGIVIVNRETGIPEGGTSRARPPGVQDDRPTDRPGGPDQSDSAAQEHQQGPPGRGTAVAQRTVALYERAHNGTRGRQQGRATGDAAPGTAGQEQETARCLAARQVLTDQGTDTAAAGLLDRWVTYCAGRRAGHPLLAGTLDADLQALVALQQEGLDWRYGLTAALGKPTDKIAYVIAAARGRRQDLQAAAADPGSGRREAQRRASPAGGPAPATLPSQDAFDAGKGAWFARERQRWLAHDEYRRAHPALDYTAQPCCGRQPHHGNCPRSDA